MPPPTLCNTAALFFLFLCCHPPDNLPILYSSATDPYTLPLHSAHCTRRDWRLNYLELLQPSRSAELFTDIAARTGIRPVRIAFNRMNLKNQSARLRVWHIGED